MNPYMMPMPYTGGLGQAQGAMQQMPFRGPPPSGNMMMPMPFGSFGGPQQQPQQPPLPPQQSQQPPMLGPLPPGALEQAMPQPQVPWWMESAMQQSPPQQPRGEGMKIVLPSRQQPQTPQQAAQKKKQDPYAAMGQMGMGMIQGKGMPYGMSGGFTQTPGF